MSAWWPGCRRVAAVGRVAVLRRPARAGAACTHESVLPHPAAMIAVSAAAATFMRRVCGLWRKMPLFASITRTLGVRGQGSRPNTVPRLACASPQTPD
ncbi:hypothetical protein I553_7086 [Mycobacterium xenopi 4042]|uniref:Uncharacterized protein n=1 Tax=Mycobacterium xenopi 4042 TaxID=1299334 RepID=X7Z4K0_MYCXE|nr:hypothetical protein I553_7086 [Mycobacterium xenopi 4042]